MRLRRYIVTVFLCSSVFSTASAGGVCWIQSVSRRTSPGVDDAILIGFVPGPTVSATVLPKSGYRFWVQDGAIVLVSPYQEKNQLLLHDGDKVILTQSVHDWCTLNVVVNSERNGVEVDADSHPNGMPASHVTTFIKAN